MTIKEKLETIKGKKIAIWCETKEESQELVNELNKITNEEYVDCYDEYSDVCYALDEYGLTGVWCYSPKNYYSDEGDFIIISYKEFINNYDKYKLDYKVCLSQQDINAILDNKYGKDNWVIR